MYVLSNALRNLRRNKGRNILLFVAAFVILLTVTVTMVIRATSVGIIEDYKSRFGAQVTMTPDFQSLTPGKEFPSITNDQQKKIAQSKTIKSTTASVNDYLRSDGKTLWAVDEKEAAADKAAGKENGMQSFGGDGSAPRNLQLIGATQLDLDKKFADGTRKVIDGAAPKAANEVLISKEFAAVNGLKVGSTINLPGGFDKTSFTYSLKVVGIYDGSDTAYPEAFQRGEHIPELNNRNQLYTTFDTIMQHYTDAANGPMVNVNYTLHNPGELEQFKQDVKAAGVDTTIWAVTTDLAKYNNIVKPVDSMNNLATVFLIVVLVLGAGILMLISVIAVRERKYEVGVLRAMGMPKKKVLTGFVTESVVLTLVALAIAIPLGLLAAKPVANGLLSAQNDSYANSAQAQQDQQQAAMQGNAGFFSSSSGGPADGAPKKNEGGLNDVAPQLNWQTILQLILTSLGLAGVASLLGIVMISRFEPIKILSDRN